MTADYSRPLTSNTHLSQIHRIYQIHKLVEPHPGKPRQVREVPDRGAGFTVLNVLGGEDGVWYPRGRYDRIGISKWFPQSVERPWFAISGRE